VTKVNSRRFDLLHSLGDRIV